MAPHISPPSICLRCLTRSIESSFSSRSTPHAVFSTSAALFANPPKKKGPVTGKPTGARQGRTLVLAKNRRATTARPPAVGERKSLKKRVVLSNTNALEVRDLRDISTDVVNGPGKLAELQGHVLGLNDDTVDALRALEAFKPTQGWSLFRRPASLIRRETVQLADELRAAQQDKTASSRVLWGERGSGKSVLMLQGMAMAYLRGWLVVHLPEARDLTMAHTSYQRVVTDHGTIYVQPHYTAQLLGNFARANSGLLSTLRLSHQHQLPIPVQSNISLSRFVELGANDPELAWPVWQALWSELTTPSRPDEKGLQRPPIFFAVDGVDHIMRASAYLDAEVKPIHAHDLALVQTFTALLSGHTTLPNGGMIMAATSGSNRPSAPTLDYCLNKMSTTSGAIRTWDPYVAIDERVQTLLLGGGEKQSRTVGVRKVQGLSKEEARGIMEYYAHSGMLRSSLTDGFVSEKWTLAGMGIIGELEKGTVRARF